VTALQKTFALLILGIYVGVAIVFVGFAYWWMNPQTDEQSKTFGVYAGLIGPRPQIPGHPAAGRVKFSTSKRPATTRCWAMKEIRCIITALGTGIGKDDFDAGKLRYHKIILMKQRMRRCAASLGRFLP